MADAATVVREDLERVLRQARTAFEFLAGKRLLVTGGAGFLGYYLVQSVVAWNQTNDSVRRIDLTVYDNFLRGTPEWLKRLMGAPGLWVTERDLREPLPSDALFDYMIHGASVASPTYYRRFPIETMDANVHGLRNLLESARRQSEVAPLKGLLFFSSSEIYGDPPEHHIPTDECYRGNVSCTGPRACYDESKRYGETLCVNFARVYGLPITVARPFNNYGPGLKITDGRALPDFAREILSERNVVLFSNGSPTRTFCYISDAVSGYFKVLTQGRPGEAYNIGVESPEVSVRELAWRTVGVARELFDYRGEVEFRRSEDAAYLTDNPSRRCPSIRKAKSELGYEPSVGLDEGLRRTLIWYAENRGGEER